MKRMNDPRVTRMLDPIVRSMRAKVAAGSTAAGGAGQAPATGGRKAVASGNRRAADPFAAYISELKKTLVQMMLEYGPTMQLNADDWLHVAAREMSPKLMPGNPPTRPSRCGSRPPTWWR